MAMTRAQMKRAAMALHEWGTGRILMLRSAAKLHNMPPRLVCNGSENPLFEWGLDHASNNADLHGDAVTYASMLLSEATRPDFEMRGRAP